MNPREREAVFNVLVKEEGKIFATKGAAYAGNDDVLSNFKRNAQNVGVSKYKVWAIYFGKHVDSVMNAIKANPDAPVDNSEGLISRIHDIRVYAALLACLLEEDSYTAKKDATS